MRKNIELVAVLTSLSIGFGLMATPGVPMVLAQVPQFPNNTETVEEFADVVEGNDTSTIKNDTNIGDTNNTLENSTEENINEDCMQVQGQSQPYCP